MKSDFRQRVVVPLALPFVTLLAIVTIAFALSRVLLTVPESAAVFIAIALAGYILLVAFLIERRPRITSRALAVGLTLGLVATAGAGVVAAAAGPRPLHEEAAEGGEGGEGAAPPEGSQTVDEVPADAVYWAASNQLEYTETPDEFQGGEVTFALELEGLEHNVVFEGFDNDEPLVEGAAAGIFVNTVEIPAGDYVFYCSIAGHREAGMEGEVTVT